MEIKTDEDILKEHGWSELGRQAYYSAQPHYDSAPSTLKASWAAHYMALWAKAYESKSISIADIERHRKQTGYTGRGAVERYEDEVLWPLVRQSEIQVRAAEQQRRTRTGNVIPFAAPASL